MVVLELVYLVENRVYRKVGDGLSCVLSVTSNDLGQLATAYDLSLPLFEHFPNISGWQP